MKKSLKDLKSKKSENLPKTSLLSTFAPKEISIDQKVIFSFELFDRTSDYFNLGETCSGWYISLLDVLKEVSKHTWRDFVQKYKNGTYDPHKYSDSSLYEYNIENFEELKENAWQFRINKSLGRVHGILIDNIFYIYWLDPHHNMTNSKGYEKSKPLKQPENCVCNLFTNKLKECYEEQREIYSDVVGDAVDNHEELMEISLFLKNKNISIKDLLAEIRTNV